MGSRYDKLRKREWHCGMVANMLRRIPILVRVDSADRIAVGITLIGKIHDHAIRVVFYIGIVPHAISI